VPTRQLRRIADDLAAVPALTARAGALVVDIATDEARRATGDGRMSGMGRRGPKLRAVVKVKRSGTASTTAEVRGVPAGPWAILQRGAGRHVIPRPPAGRVLYGRGMRHAVSGPIRHPGTRGKRSWSRVVSQARAEVPDVFGDAVRQAVRR
jgi:hypothetical protein